MKKIQDIIFILLGLVTGIALTAFSISYAAPAIVQVVNGGTGWAALQANTVLLGNGKNPVGTTTPGTNGQVLMLSGGVPTWYSTTSSSGVTSITLGGGLDGLSPITTTGTIIGQVGTSSVPSISGLAYWTGAGTPSLLSSVATTTLTTSGVLNLSNPVNVLGATPSVLSITGSQGWLNINDAGVANSSTSPTVNYITATSTTATSTFSNGINLSNNGCFADNGTCLQTIITNSSAYKQAVTYASTSTLPTYTYNNGASGVGATITGVANGPLYLDGSTLNTLGTRVLIKNETGGNAPNNGIYTVTTVGVAGLTPFVLTRATDYNSSLDVFPGVSNFVNSGTTNANTCWVLTNTSAVTIGVTALTYDDACGAGSFTGTAPITITGTTIALTTPLAVQYGGTGQTSFSQGWLTVKDDLTVTSSTSPTVAYITATSTKQASSFQNASTTQLTATNAIYIPNSATSPTLQAAGQIAIETTTASSSIHVATSTQSTDFVIYPTVDRTGVFASSTLAYIGGFGSSGTTTLPLGEDLHPETITNVACYTDSGTAEIAIGTGSASTTQTNAFITCTTSGGIQFPTSNNTFTARQQKKIDFGSTTGTPNLVTVTYTVKQNDD